MRLGGEGKGWHLKIAGPRLVEIPKSFSLGKGGASVLSELTPARRLPLAEEHTGPETPAPPLPRLSIGCQEVEEAS